MNKVQIKIMIDQLWEKYDSNKNGVIEKKELNEFLKELFDDNEDHLSKEDLKLIMKEIDTNCDQTVTKEEILAFIYKE